MSDEKGGTTLKCLRSLDNYIEIHKKLAEERGVGARFKNARTLTEARKILFGVKPGQRALKTN